jgi:multidrug efflux pump subunit AcrA (membrane-fusion protein)
LPWWRRPRLRVIGAVLVLLLLPVRLTVLAPGELVPANPAIIRAPLEGVIGQFHVAPNETVKAGQLLFGFDEASLAARRDVAAQALLTAETEYRQFAHQAVTDTKSKAQLAQLLGKIEERKAEAGYLGEQLERARVTSPINGVALFDDPAEWIGRPVQTGERVLRVAAQHDVEVEAWVAVGDAITLDEDAAVTLYLSANPLSSLTARLRYLSHDAVARPNGLYAYRLRARLTDSTDQRVGLKGTVKVQGHWVVLGYWVLRRPLAAVRQTLGI